MTSVFFHKMTSRRCDMVTLAVILFIIGNVVFHCDSATSMESESHVRSKMYCDFYNRTCAESAQQGLDDGCPEKQECVQEDGKLNNHCFVVWKEEEGNISVHLKGCIFTNEDCNNTKCVETREPTKQYLYCCCKGYMCNRNFSWEPQPKPPPPVLKEVEPITKPASLTLIHWIIYLVVPVLIFAAVIFAWLFRRNKHMFNELPTTDQNPIAPPSPLMGQSSIQLIEVKARGRFGAVWKAQLKGEEVAVKIFPIQDKQSWVQEKQIFQLPNMEHPNILHFIGVEKRGDNLQAEFWLVTAYHDKGSLCDYLKAHTLSFPVLCRIVETMARGLMHLHEEIPGKHGELLKPSVAHRDFKSKNVLLKNDMTACIADFGLALVFESGKSCGDTHGQVGTRRYMAPEVLEGAINFTPDAFLRIDMYACGLVLWELVSRCTAQGGIIPEYRLPFEEEVGQHPSLEDMQEAVVQRKVRPTIPEMWRSNPGLVSLCETMEECWDHDAEARLSASCVMERVLNQSKYQHSTLSMRIENEAPRSPFKENSM